MTHEAESTERLLLRARDGDAAALDQLFARHIPPLQQWASGRLPRWARDIADTHDLVQETVLQTLKHIDRFVPQGDDALQAYLRHAVMNRIRNELRRAHRKPAPDPLDSAMPAEDTRPDEFAARRQQQDRYESALATLSDHERELIVARLELGLTYEEMASRLGKPSWNAARMATARALVKLAEVLTRERQ